MRYRVWQFENVYVGSFPTVESAIAIARRLGHCRVTGPAASATSFSGSGAAATLKTLQPA